MELLASLSARQYRWLFASSLVQLSLGVALTATAADVTSTWLGGAGSWTDGSRWSTAPVFPENGALTYEAVIEETIGVGDITLARDLTIDGLRLRIAGLQTSGTLTVLNGVTLASSVQLTGPGSAVFGGTSSISGNLWLSGIHVENRGDVSYSAGSPAAGTIIFESASFTNTAGARFTTVGGTAQLDLSAFGTSSFTNHGTFTQNTQGFTGVSVPFNSDGLVDVQRGTLMLTGGGASSGAFQVASGAELHLSGNLLTGSTITGAGTVELGATLDGLLDFDGTTRVRLPATINSTANSTARLALTGAATQGLTLNGTLSVTDRFDWLGGTLRGTGQMSLGGAMRIQGSGMTLDSLDLEASHGIEWYESSLTLGHGAQLTNPSGAVTSLLTQSGNITVTGDSTPGAGIVNSGTMLKQGGQIADFGVPFQTSGSVHVEEGTLGASRGLSNSGQILVDAGASLRVGGSGAPPATQSDFTSTSVVSGPGTVLFSTGTQNLRGSFLPGAIRVMDQANVHFLEPTPVFAAEFSSNGGFASFDAGPVVLSRVTNLGGVLSLRNGSRLEGGLQWVFGTLTGEGEITTTGPVEMTQSTIRAVNVRNEGAMTFHSLVTFENGGSLTNAPGATLRASNGTYGVFGSSSVIRNQGYFLRDFQGPTGPGGVTSFAPAFVNTGVVEIQGAGYSSPFKSSAEFVSYEQTAGELRLSGGDVRASGVTALEITGGSLVGSGHVFANVDNGGRIAPGDTGEIGQLEVASTLSLGATSALEFDLAGTTRGVSFDSLDVRSIFLDGELSVRFVGDFGATVTPADQFEILRARNSPSGSFDNAPALARLLTADGLGTFQVLYDVLGSGGTHSIVLTDFRPVPESELGVFVTAFVAVCLVARRRRVRSG